MRHKTFTVLLAMFVVIVGIYIPSAVYAYNIWHNGIDEYDKEVKAWSEFPSATKNDITTAAGTYNDLLAYLDFIAIGDDHSNNTYYPYDDGENQITEIDEGEMDYFGLTTLVERDWIFWPFTWYLVEADINMNPYVDWSSDPGWNEVDVQSVVLHEFGHFLGLAHSEYEDAVMYPGLQKGVKKRVLYYDDSNGIYAIY